MFWKKLIVISSLLLFPFISFAQTTGTVTASSSPMLNRLKGVGVGAGYGAATEMTLIDVVGTAINGVLGLMGTIFIILMLLAGYNWMTANGDDEKVTKAKTIIRQAIIGIIIVAGAFAIWNFIATYLVS
ncbi:MAG: hypothetical protein NTY12_04860 [Candidatus Falkowbacteria bacterium]|nr:hypothetical protein [Candidatus Falkowbacteria bacterium]